MSPLREAFWLVRPSFPHDWMVKNLTSILLIGWKLQVSHHHASHKVSHLFLFFPGLSDFVFLFTWSWFLPSFHVSSCIFLLAIFSWFEVLNVSLFRDFVDVQEIILQINIDYIFNPWSPLVWIWIIGILTARVDKKF